MGEIAMMSGIGRAQRNGAAMGGDRLGRTLQILQTNSEIIVNLGKIGLQRQRLAIGAGGIAMPVGLVEGDPQLKARLNIVRIDFYTLQARRNQQSLHRTLWSPDGLPKGRQLHMSLGRGRIGIDRLVEEIATLFDGSAAQQQGSQRQSRRWVTRPILEQAAIQDLGARPVPVLLVFRCLR